MRVAARADRLVFQQQQQQLLPQQNLGRSAAGCSQAVSQIQVKPRRMINEMACPINASCMTLVNVWIHQLLASGDLTEGSLRTDVRTPAVSDKLKAENKAYLGSGWNQETMETGEKTKYVHVWLSAYTSINSRCVWWHTLMWKYLNLASCHWSKGLLATRVILKAFLIYSNFKT